MSDLTDLVAARTLAITAYKDAVTNPKPTYKIEGEMVQASEYRASLLAEIKLLTQIIGDEEAPWIEQSQGYC